MPPCLNSDTQTHVHTYTHTHVLTYSRTHVHIHAYNAYIHKYILRHVALPEAKECCVLLGWHQRPRREPKSGSTADCDGASVGGHEGACITEVVEGSAVVAVARY